MCIIILTFCCSRTWLILRLKIIVKVLSLPDICEGSRITRGQSYKVPWQLDNIPLLITTCPLTQNRPGTVLSLILHHMNNHRTHVVMFIDVGGDGSSWTYTIRAPWERSETVNSRIVWGSSLEWSIKKSGTTLEISCKGTVPQSVMVPVDQVEYIEFATNDIGSMKYGIDIG